MNYIEFFTGNGWKVTSPFGPRPSNLELASAIRTLQDKSNGHKV